MTNKTALPLLFIATCLFLSCKDNETSYAPYEEQMKDSIFKYYPTVASITINIKDKSQMDVVLGSVQMFETSDAVREKIANEMGMMALQIFPKDNDLNRGRLIVSKDEHSTDVDISKSKIRNINIDSLRKISSKQ